MGSHDPRVDAYIAQAGDFAKPILIHLRGVVHRACPRVEETMKWGFPHFMYEGILCSMAAFKHHCAFGFWKGSQIVMRDAEAVGDAMGQFGRITAVSDLPSRTVLGDYIHQAMRLNEARVGTATRPPRTAPPRLVVPDDLATALEAHGQARATFDALSPSHKREYVEWITEAKRADTRTRRLQTAIAWMAEGKPRNWKYMKS